jgi:hypothetical protein
MSYLQKAIEAAIGLERELQNLIAEASRNGEYDDVAKIAALAGSFGELVKRLNLRADSLVAPRLVVKPVRARVQSKDSATPSGRSTERRYPLFERDSDRLVKVGWSKKAKSIYEHKAPIEVCRTVCLRLAEAETNGVFRMEDFFPLLDSDAQEIPTYQSYMVLGWLRSLDLIEKSGKDGYKWTSRFDDDEGFIRAWKDTPQRKQTRGGA